MNTIFLDENGTLRGGWRAAIFLLTYFFLALIPILLFVTVVNIFARLPFGKSAAGFLPLVVPFAFSTAIAITLGWLFGKIFEQLPFRALGASFSAGWLINLALGCVVGAVAFVSAVLIAMMSGSLQIAFNTDSSASAISATLLSTLLIVIVAAASEETLFRGYLLQTLARSNLAWIGVVVTSLLFAILHNANPSAGKLSFLNTLLAGVWFAAAYFKTRDLWFPFGIHVAWNWLQGPIFGINVSGMSGFASDPILRTIDSGPAWLTGAKYGIEGGVACTVALVLSMAVIYFMPLGTQAPSPATPIPPA